MTEQREIPWTVTPEVAVSAVRDVASGHGKLDVVSKVHVGSLREIATLYMQSSKNNTAATTAA
jgi:malate dehydrogenase (oxaloacetate-decarboxylating)